ncbi:MAG: hypothetical protein KDA60_14845, partial [Planctomycetales bacterium]|nr:hypothetical protein [Planctomycetales bacterium]
MADAVLGLATGRDTLPSFERFTMNFNPAEMLQLFRKHQRLLLWCVGTTTTLALLAAVFKPSVWCARQGLIVRDEVVGDINRFGRFESTDAMQTAQETILEIARHKSVVEEALRDVGPTRGKRKKDWPRTSDIEAVQDAVSIAAPKGAQFGRTEVIYLVVKAGAPERAVALNTAVCDHLEKRLQEVRNEKYRSITAELVKTVAVAQDELDKATARVQALERTVGANLPELRNMIDNSSGDGPLGRSLNEIMNELRQLRSSYTTQKQQREMIHLAQRDPDELLATPNQLLESQPALRRLKEG